ncbi:GNAT family N-acetyltransferase [Spongiibacter sp. KMU-158]|uniref:GNAT family N-acetyltransferase n=1 Tax=Spongiibacter pelagi TaxID=2760804 RepID=A0A927C3P7_9GAMM|nr:GNAT family N-acetyltransferase [Spongiibacter pelagi]MBD2859242.1 GNAT family N-acetyltransferase [Spongiibacter pelagi]
MIINIQQTDWSTDFPTLYSIREAVFVHEQQVPVELEIDDQDFISQHWIAFADGQPVGTARLTPDGKIGRMAVLKPYRKAMVGTHLLRAIIQAGIAQNFRELSLSAQLHALHFYAKEGFVAEGPVFMDAGIPHQTMRVVLRKQRELGVDGKKFRIRNLPESVLDMSGQCRRSLRVLSPSLEPEIYGSDSFVDQVSQLARKHRDVTVRFLIHDDKPLRENRHQLVTLSQKLSAVEIRVLPRKQIVEQKECYLLADNCGLLVHHPRINADGWGSYNLRPIAEDYITRFDRQWHHSKPSPWLRTLY